MPENSEKWLRVIGIGEDGWADLGTDAKSLLYESHVVLGGERHLKMLPDEWKGERIFWTSPMRESVQKILSFRPCLLYTSPSPRDRSVSRMPSSA